MDGPAERACFVFGVSLQYADTFSQCGHSFWRPREWIYKSLVLPGWTKVKPLPMRVSLANWYGVKIQRNVTLVHRSKTTIRQPQPALLATLRRKRVGGFHLLASAVSASRAGRHARSRGRKPARFQALHSRPSRHTRIIGMNEVRVPQVSVKAARGYCS